MAGTDDAGLRRAGWLGNRPLLIALLFLATVAGIGVVVVQETSSGDSGLPEEIERYLAAWTAGDFAAMQRLVVEPPDDFVTAHQQMHASLFISQARFDAGEGEFARGEGAVPVEARFALGGLGVWEYDITLRLERVDGDWRVRWTPATLHPDLAPGMRFARTRSTPPRAPLTDRNGLPLTDTVLPSIVGSVAPANAEQAAELGPEHQAGDVVGQGGLQQRYNALLSGKPSGEVQLVPPDGGAPRVVKVFEGTAPEPVRTSLDPRVQRAAEDAISIASGPAALVAIDPESGGILAIANNPSDGANRAISGVYPPGSTFKVVTTNALLQAGVQPEVPVDCPETANGFGNFAGESFGTIPFAEAFYRSCNTAFILQAGGLPEGALESAAVEFGFNTPYDIGVESVGGSFPPPQDQANALAGSIGQGQVTASPLHMASVAAAVKSGTWHPPSLAPEAEAETGSPPEPFPLDPEVDAVLQDLMRQVVSNPNGTGTAAAIPGRDIGGKTGTAEFGPEDPPETHAWFIGFDEQLAFSVIVEGGGSGGSVAAPLANRFLAALPPA